MKPNAHYTEIAFTLDRSGSMKSCQQAAIDGFNRFLAEQGAAIGDSPSRDELFRRFLEWQKQKARP